MEVRPFSSTTARQAGFCSADIANILDNLRDHRLTKDHKVHLAHPTVNRFVELVDNGLMMKLRHPLVKDALCRFFTFRNDADNDFFINVMQAVAKRIDPEHPDRFLKAITESMSDSRTLVGMTGVRAAAERLLA